MTISDTLRRGLLVIGALIVAAIAHAEPVFMKRSWDYALNGYDTVAYHTDGIATRGVQAFTAEYLGQTWLFASAENRDRFEADPDAYRPQYGGYCAWAMAKGQGAPGNPEAWHIEGGKLYLNVSEGIKNRWLRDLDGFIQRADAEWPAFAKAAMP